MSPKISRRRSSRVAVQLGAAGAIAIGATAGPAVAAHARPRTEGARSDIDPGSVSLGGDEPVATSQSDTRAAPVPPPPYLAPPLGAFPNGVDANGDDISAHMEPIPVPGTTRSAPQDSMYPARGFSVVPPNDGTFVCYRHRNENYLCRVLQGVEKLGDDEDYVVASNLLVSKSGYDDTFGRSLVAKSGILYEGCKVKDPDHYRCDFRSVRQVSSLIPHSQDGYEWRTFEERANATATSISTCGAKTMGVWLNANSITDAAQACASDGPYAGYRP